MIIVVHDAYQSLLKTALQSIKSGEVIVVENNDNTLAYACNRGIERARGEYIVRVDADDWIEPDLIARELNYLENHDCDAVWCDYWKTYEHYEGVHELEYYSQPDLEHACGVMFKRKCWEELGGYDENLPYQESYEFWHRFKQYYKAEHLELPLYYYRQHDGSMSTNPERLEVREMINKGIH